MATISGGGSNGHHTLRLYLSESNVDTANNKSRVNWNLTIQGGSGWDFYTIAGTLKVVINGTTVHDSYNTRDYDGSGNEYSWASGSIDITHNTDGSKRIGASFSYNDTYSQSYSVGSASGYGEMDLTKINRYATTNSVTGNNIEESFSVSYTKYVNDYKYKLRISVPNVQTLETINYNTSGTSFTLSKQSIDTLYDLYPDTNTFNLGFRVETWNSAGTSKLSDGNEKTISCSKTDRIARIRIGNEWKRATPYVRVSGEWKKAIPYTRINNEWKRGR